MNRLKELRETLGLSQKEIGIILGVSERAVQEWEGGRRNPKHRKEIEEKLESLSILTEEEIKSVLEGTLEMDYIVFQKKLWDVKRLSRGTTFTENWNKIPESIKEKLSAKELVELLNTYDN